MKNSLIPGLLGSATLFLLLTGCTSQEKIPAAPKEMDAVINAREVERIEKTLASDDMQGRKIFTPGIDKAADFIAAEFKAAGLQTWNNSGTYKQDFSIVKAKSISASGTFDGVALEEKDINVITSRPELSINQG